MACVSCGSDKQGEFVAEMNIHFPGMEGLEKPAVLVIPKILVCFDCGVTLFALLEDELRQLEEGVAA